MDTKAAQELIQKYAPAMCFISVKDKKGDLGIGSAFHVGEGVFVTARHVVEGNEILEIQQTEYIRVPENVAIPEYRDEQIEEISKAAKNDPSWPETPQGLVIEKGPFFHKNEMADVAVFRVSGIHPHTPFVPLGSHLDDWINASDWRLSETIILGYPPIPFTREPSLFCARGEINCVLWTDAQSHATFIISVMPRGGFSGGLALHEWDFVLGLVTQSLLNAGQPSELGYLSVLSVEPIFECLADAKLLPNCQREAWEDFWNTKGEDFIDSTGLVQCGLSVFDDGKSVYVTIMGPQPEAFKIALQTVGTIVADNEAHREIKREDWVIVHVGGNDAAGLAKAALVAARIAILDSPLKLTRATLGGEI